VLRWFDQNAFLENNRATMKIVVDENLSMGVVLGIY
jgi:hypothetical protein